MTVFRDGRPICWTGTETTRPGCAGCRYSVTTHPEASYGELCRERHARFHSPRYRARLTIVREYDQLMHQDPERKPEDIAQDLTLLHFPRITYRDICRMIYEHRRAERTNGQQG